MPVVLSSLPTVMLHLHSVHGKRGLHFVEENLSHPAAHLSLQIMLGITLLLQIQGLISP